MTEISISVWFPSPEEKVWDALKEHDVEPIDNENTIPGPVLRMLKERYVKERYGKYTEVIRFFKITNRTNGEIQYALIPKDTQKYGSVFSNHNWLKKREQKWVEIKSMSPDQIEKAIAEIVENYMITILNPQGTFNGIDLATEVYNWTALDFDTACEYAAKELIKQLLVGRVRKTHFFDQWVFIEHESQQKDEDE
jgi:hypothetical protein